MVSRTRRTVFRAPTVSPPRNPSPGPGHSRSGSSRPRDAPREGDDVPREVAREEPAVPPTEPVQPTEVESRREGRTSRSRRSSSRRTLRDENIARMMEMMFESQQQMRDMRVDIARLQKRPMEETSEPSDVPTRPPHFASASAPPRRDVPDVPPPPPVVRVGPAVPASIPSVPPVPPVPVPEHFVGPTLETPTVPTVQPTPSPTTPVSAAAQMHTSSGTVPLYPVYVPGFGVVNGEKGDTISRHLFEVGEGSNKRKRDDSDWQVGKFLKNGGRMFAGKTDPDEADRWFITAEGVFRSLGCPPELWVRIISGAFKDDARAWWESVRETHFGKREPKDISWEEFQKAFDEKYFPLEVRKMKELEFEKLVQGSMSVAEYEAKFTRLQRFALDELR